ncbi:MAG: potassium/proton antiporter [Oligoflexia bacterium]|nr:potassium/proton antiporter [Oligoflexia bacterium]
MLSVEQYLIIFSILLLFAVLASKASSKFGIPSLIIFLCIGMLAGSDGPGGINFDNATLTQYVGIVALIYILFSGGLDTNVQLIKPILKHGIILSTIGVILTCLFLGLFLPYTGQITFKEGLLLGAIVSSTDAAAVFMILRSKGIHLKPNLRSILEFESGANDPMAVFLTIAILELITAAPQPWYHFVVMFVKQMGIGLLAGLLMAFIFYRVINQIRLEFDGLYPVLSLAYIILIYAATQMVGGSGFLAVYLAGVYLGNKKFIHKKSLILFHDGLAWLMQIVMFITLGLMVFPSRLPSVAATGLIVSAFLILVARPMAVFISLIFSKMNFKEKLTISWIGLRGSVPIILATYPYTAGYSKADTFFHLVFFIVFTSVVLQGTTISFIAKLLKVNINPRKRIRFPIEYVPKDDMKGDLFEFELSKGSPVCGRAIVDIDLPANTLIVLVQREGRIIVPRGTTVLSEDDLLLLLADKESLKSLGKIFNSDFDTVTIGNHKDANNNEDNVYPISANDNVNNKAKIVNE